MNKDYLLETASKLQPVNAKAAGEYQEKSPEMVSKLNTLLEKRQDIEKLVGKANREMMKDNHSNHARFIATMLKNYNANVFVETVLWVFNAYQHHGFSSNYWAAQLNTWISILKSELSDEAYREIFPYYEWMQTHIPILVKVSSAMDENLTPSHS